jgi:hypothetical protein
MRVIGSIIANIGGDEKRSVSLPVQAATDLDRVTVRARVWAEGSAEPGVWQAETYDESSTRITAGAGGVRTYGPGDKYFDDLVVRPLPSYTTTRVITYTYECTASLKRSERDNLYHLTGGDYCTGEEFSYAYDPVGNPVSAYASRDRLSHCPHPYPDGHYRHHLCLPFDCAHLPVLAPPRGPGCLPRAGTVRHKCR